MFEYATPVFEWATPVFEKGERGFESPGTGFGLSLVREIVDAYDGEVAVESERGKGTTFAVTLPRV